MSKKSYRYPIVYGNRYIAFSDRVKVTCTRCRRTKPISEFGLRDMGDGTIRNQAQCMRCRGKK